MRLWRVSPTGDRNLNCRRGVCLSQHLHPLSTLRMFCLYGLRLGKASLGGCGSQVWGQFLAIISLNAASVPSVPVFSRDSRYTHLRPSHRDPLVSFLFVPLLTPCPSVWVTSIDLPPTHSCLLLHLVFCDSTCCHFRYLPTNRFFIDFFDPLIPLGSLQVPILLWSFPSLPLFSPLKLFLLRVWIIVFCKLFFPPLNHTSVNSGSPVSLFLLSVFLLCF